MDTPEEEAEEEQEEEEEEEEEEEVEGAVVDDEEVAKKEVESRDEGWGGSKEASEFVENTDVESGTVKKRD